MFRAAAPGPYDEAIAKATDENLTSEDWGAIMEVCDRVTTDPNGPKEACQSLIKRLAHRNANVQLYTLEVANALSQNCGKNMHRELSSRAFTDALLKLANDRNTHREVKPKILERMKDWSDMFKSDPDLGIMYDAYYRLKQTNPTLQPPSAPQKNSLTEVDRQKEEEELQEALRLSLQEEERKKSVPQAGPSTAAGPSRSSAGAAQSSTALQPMSSGTTAATVSRVRALFDFVPSEPGELEFKKGDVIAVLESVYKDWWRGSLKGKTGIFPLNYVEKLTDPTPDELQREAQMEAEVFAEIKNVEKLLTLLSTNNTAPREEDNEEISKLYHQTLAIRPKLIKLIEKYSQKKDDFTQLNEKFIKARRDYDALMESSMAHPPGPSYQQYAMRPSIPQGYPSGGPGYPSQGPPAGGPGYPSQGPPGGGNYPSQAPPQHDQQQFYTPAPQEPQYPTQSPSPNYQRPNNNAAPPPFYMAGAEVPPQGGPAQSQQQQQQQQYPRPDQGHRIPSRSKPLAPIQPSSPPPSNNPYSAYQGPGGGQRPQSNYGGAPQELSTSVYDSPIAPHNPQSAGGATYTSSVYSPDEMYHAGPIGSPNPNAPSAPGPPAPTPSAPDNRPGYQPYTSYSQQPSQPPYGRYDGGADDPVHPPAPSGQAPPPPIPQTRPDNVLTSPPLQPSGPAYNARQSPPSSRLYASPPPQQRPDAGQQPHQQQQQAPQQPQYKAYVPPGASQPANDGPSAPGDYYRTAAY